MSTDTTGQAPTIPDDMIEAAAKALFDAESRRINPVSPLARDRYREQARRALTAALVGRTVVDLPEPDNGDDCWYVDDIDVHGYAQEPRRWVSDKEFEVGNGPAEPHVLIGSVFDVSPGVARRVAVALLAAADHAEQLAGEVDDAG